MPVFEPFRALRYDPTRVDPNDVVAPPYDVINDSQREALVKRSPYNAIVVEVPKGSDSADRYSLAAQQLEQWQRDGILLRDDEPTFYAYRMTYQGLDGSDRRTTGVLGALGVPSADKPDVLPHEHTIPKAKSDRLDLLRATQVNVSPIWGLSLAEGLTNLCQMDDDAVFEAEVQGVLHQLWLIPPERTDEIRALVGTAPIVIADGHHRWETAMTYSAERREKDGPGPWDLALAFVVELVEDELEIGPIHRLIHGEFSIDMLLEHLGNFYDLEQSTQYLTIEDAVAEVERTGTTFMATQDKMWQLRATPKTHANATEDLDSARLSLALEGFAESTVSYANNANEVREALDVGSCQAAFVIGPATIAIIAEVAHGGRRMPPKTTFFRPKPRTGMVFRPLQ